MLQPVITKALIAALRREFALDWNGFHGAGHWARVRHNGLLLAPATGAVPHIVELFAFLHDVKRQDDGADRHHGKRAAEFARSLHGTHFHLDDRDMDTLVVACAGHTFETASSDPTVLTCWDADRLDLGRVGIVPDPSRLCTDAARDPDVIMAAFARSRVQTSLRYTTLRGVSCES